MPHKAENAVYRFKTNLADRPDTVCEIYVADFLNTVSSPSSHLVLFALFREGGGGVPHILHARGFTVDMFADMALHQLVFLQLHDWRTVPAEEVPQKLRKDVLSFHEGRDGFEGEWSRLDVSDLLEFLGTLMFIRATGDALPTRQTGSQIQQFWNMVRRVLGRDD